TRNEEKKHRRRNRGLQWGTGACPHWSPITRPRRHGASRRASPPVVGRGRGEVSRRPGAESGLGRCPHVRPRASAMHLGTWLHLCNDRKCRLVLPRVLESRSRTGGAPISTEAASA